MSKLFKWLFQLAFFLLPILLIVFWCYAQPLSATLADYGINFGYIPKGIKILHTLSVQTKLLGFIIGLIPLTVKLFILYFLIQLFKLFEAYEIFSYKNVRYIKYIGYTIFIGQMLNPIYQALISATLTWGNPVGERSTMISFSSTNFSILLVALLIILTSWIMAEGYKIQEEQKYTI